VIVAAVPEITAKRNVEAAINQRQSTLWSSS
jgi:hypothetical protein